MAINVLVLGLRSELANEFLSSVGCDFNCVHASARESESVIKERLSTKLDAQPFLLVDFTVYSTRRELDGAVRLVHSLCPHKYIMLSTAMHGLEGSLFLSSYRKMKLLQESVLFTSFKKKLIVIRLPDVIDSRAWLSHRAPDGVYRFQSYKSIKKEILGVTKGDVVRILENKARGNQVDVTGKTNFVLQVEKIPSFKGRLRARLKLWVSRSLFLGQLLARVRRGKESGVDLPVYVKVDLAGGFADLI